jgi:hypothetical protein
MVCKKCSVNSKPKRILKKDIRKDKQNGISKKDLRVQESLKA